MTGKPFDEALDELFAAPLEDFILTRTALAARLRAAGDAKGAAALARVAKPSRSVWATNQAVRHAPERLAELFAATDALARAQVRAPDAPDARERFRAAVGEQRRALAALLEVARQRLAEAGMAAGAALRERIEENLRGGALSEAVRPVLMRGRLEAEVPAQDFTALLARAPAAPIAAKSARAARPSGAEARGERGASADSRRGTAHADGAALHRDAGSKARSVPKGRGTVIDGSARTAKGATARSAAELKAARRAAAEAHREATRLAQRRAEMRAETLRAELRHLQVEAGRARKDADQTELALGAAREHVAALKEALERAQLALRDAERAHTAAQSSVVSRHAEAAVAERRLAEAEKALEDARRGG